MGTVDDIRDLLFDSAEQISAATTLHDGALSDHRQRTRFRTRIKNVLENQRSALDYLAVGIMNKYGTPKGLLYYPLAHSPEKFDSLIDAKMPGVRKTQPFIAAAIKLHQPFDCEWLRHLSQLTREQKHNRLSFQLVRDVYQCRVTETATGAYVQWKGLHFRYLGVGDDGRALAAIDVGAGGGTVEMRPEANRDPSTPKPFWVGEGPTVVTTFGVPVDPGTQQPYPDPRLLVESGRVQEWCFTTPHLPVFTVLGAIQEGVEAAVREILRAAPL